jgi:RHS repeat-associated protein
VPSLTKTYSYAGIKYANPHAPTQITNGVSTTTFAYDNNGNVVQKTVDGTTTTYVWDYANRLIALGVGGATTTFGYDAFGTRVLQTGTSTTSIYPFKWYSVASSTGTGAKFATTTDYVFNGDTLVATIDQQTASGNATGTAKTRYIHPDHLGSTNVVTDENGNVSQTLDYNPYGGTRISDGTGASEKRKFIGQFADDSGLDYLNARYYSPTQGQFVSEDPSFLAVGDPMKVREVTGRDQQEFLADPQLANSYSYGRDNPITQKDPNGNTALDALVIQLFKGTSFAEGIATAGDKAADFFQMYGNPNFSATQQIGTAIDVGIPLTLTLVPSFSPVAIASTIWDVFVFTGEKITGRPASDAEAYVEALKEHPREGLKVPGINLAPAYRPGSSGSSDGSIAPISGTGSNGRPQPQTYQGGIHGFGGSQSFNAQFAAQIASIQKQIQSIQSQINQISQSKTEKR